MKVIRISAVWCSSCLYMKSKFNKIAKDMNIEIVDYDYDIDTDIVNKYNVQEVLPFYIYNDKVLKGEHTEEEIRKFLSD